MTLKENINKTLQALPKRMHEVLARRFGLARGKPETLEAIGKSYGITRERVRQIEAHALRLLERPESKQGFAPFVREARAYLERHGGVRRHDLARSELGAKWGGDKASASQAEFVLESSEAFLLRPETETHQAFWALNEGAVKRCEDFVSFVIGRLKKERRLVAADDLPAYLAGAARSLFSPARPRPEVLHSYLSVSKAVAPNPFGHYGLASWPEVSPRGVRDYAYLVFGAVARPLHFREVAKEMNGRLALKQRAHEQTVHNELIKDGRFVLVGRGMYALKEWGYQPGTVREVLSAVLAQSPAPLTREEIVRELKNRRLVKENTVFLNLQNRKYFMRLADGRYTLNNKGIQRA